MDLILGRLETIYLNRGRTEIAEGKSATKGNEETTRSPAMAARSPAIAARSPAVLGRKQIAGQISRDDSAAIAVFSPAILNYARNPLSLSIVVVNL